MIETLAAALKAIVDLDPKYDSDSNDEWGEAHCFTQAQQIAEKALAGFTEKGIYLVTKNHGLPMKIDPWDNPYDKYHGFVICAESEESARAIATKSGGDEVDNTHDCWMNPRFSSCTRIGTSFANSGVMLADYTGD